MAGGGNGTALPHDDAVALYLALTLILLVARILGEIAKKLNQPSVMGELLAGVLLGKTCLYYISEPFFNYLFSPLNKSSSALAGVTSICVTLYMLVAGLEMNMQNAMKKKGPSFSVGFFALAVPFALGYIFCYFFPEAFGLPEGKSVNNFALFTATAMAITALPVVAKTLRDLHLFKTDLGVVVMSAAVFDDILGWSLFAITLAVSNGESSSNGLSLAASISISIIYVIFILTVGSYVVDKALPYIQAYFSYPPGELGFVCLFALASSTFALWVGLHNTLGAFVVGAAIGNSRHFRHEMRETLDTFVSFMLAPIFFGSVCIAADFASDFDAGVVFAIFFLSCAGKLLGGFIGAKLAGSNFTESIAVAICMNSRGAMELVLAQVALNVGIIDGKVFVALVFMAIITSIIPGPLLRYILRRPATISVLNLVPRHGYKRDSDAKTMQEAVREMAESLGHPELGDIAIARESMKANPVWENLAVPTVISKTLKKPLAALFTFPGDGLLWNPRASNVNHPARPDRPKLENSSSRDNSSNASSSLNENHVRYAVLLLIPENDLTTEFDLMREVAMLFAGAKFRRELDAAQDIVQLWALFQIEKNRQGMSGHDPNPTPLMAFKETGMLAMDVREIIQNSPPRAQTGVPDLVFSPRTVEMLQGGIDLNENPPPPLDPDAIVEIKPRTHRQETTKELLNTIEGYVSQLNEGGEIIRKTSNLDVESQDAWGRRRPSGGLAKVAAASDAGSTTASNGQHSPRLEASEGLDDESDRKSSSSSDENGDNNNQVSMV